MFPPKTFMQQNLSPLSLQKQVINSTLMDGIMLQLNNNEMLLYV